MKLSDKDIILIVGGDIYSTIFNHKATQQICSVVPSNGTCN
jgi:hypothetical protein